MKIKKQDYNEITVAELSGDFTADYAKLFRDTATELISEGKIGIVLDMSKVPFIDSAALEEMLWLRDYCYDNKRQLKLAGLDENCQKILQITRIEQDFDKYVELSEAVKSFT